LFEAATPTPIVMAGLDRTAVRLRRKWLSVVTPAKLQIPLAGLDPAIHAFSCAAEGLMKTWVAGTSPATGVKIVSWSAKCGKKQNRTAMDLIPPSAGTATADIGVAEGVDHRDKPGDDDGGGVQDPRDLGEVV
jgi:hypothetical protein